VAGTEVIGRVNGQDVKWNSRTGEIFVREAGLFSSHDVKLDRRATTVVAVFALVEDYLRRKGR
jgi:hypothetical protein